MADTVNQTLPTMLQSAPTRDAAPRARAERSGADSFSSSLERSLSRSERPAENKAERPAAQREQAPQADARRESTAPQDTERTEGDTRTEPADGEPPTADQAPAVEANGTAEAAAHAAAIPADPASLAATPAALAATPAVPAAADGDAEPPLDAGMPAKPATATELLARAEVRGEGRESGRADVTATGEQSRTAELPRTGKPVEQPASLSTPRAVPNFAAQLDARLETAGRPLEALAPAGAQGTAPGAMAAHLPQGMPVGTERPAAAQAAQAALPMHVGTPATSENWADAVGNRVLWLAGRDESRAELILTPPQLGKLEISLTVAGDTTTAQFTAATPAAREALEQAMPRLREMLEQAGVTLAESNVNTAPQDQAGGRGDGRPGHGGRHGVGDAAADTTTPRAGPWLSRGQGLIDTFA